MYNVVILAEQAMSAGDAQTVVSLHESIDDARHYHVLIPCDSAAERVEHALGAMAASESPARPPVVPAAIDVEGLQDDIDDTAGVAVEASVAAIRALGVEADGEFSMQDPVDALAKITADQQAAEVIVMTRPHIVAEFLHLDWASRARRRLGVPLLHLVEHEPLDAEAGDGQGITGM